MAVIGYIYNLTPDYLMIRSLGWVMQGGSMELLNNTGGGTEDDTEYSFLLEAASELEELILAADIRIDDVTNNFAALQPDQVRNWIHRHWGPPSGFGSGIGLQRIAAVQNGAVQASSLKAMGFSDTLPFTLGGFYIPKASVIRQANWTVATTNFDRVYELQLFSSPTAVPDSPDSPYAPVFVATLLTMQLDQIQVQAQDLAIPLAAGEYGLFIRSVAGSGLASSFLKSGTELIFEEEQ